MANRRQVPAQQQEQAMNQTERLKDGKPTFTLVDVNCNLTECNFSQPTPDQHLSHRCILQRWVIGH